MAHLVLRHVDVEFPLFRSDGRSLRRAIQERVAPRNLRVGASQEVHVAALQDISLEIAGGDRVALIGRNGAGKTTLLKVLAGIYEPVRGDVFSSGRLQALLAPTLGLDLEATGWQNITLMGIHLGIHPRVMEQHAQEIAEWTELGAFLHAPLKTYSAGMLARLSFATATCQPCEILLLDEWLSAGDVSFQFKAYERMRKMVEQASIVVLASHSMDLLETWCNRAVLLDQGRLIAFGEFAEIRHQYLSEFGNSPADAHN